MTSTVEKLSPSLGVRINRGGALHQLFYETKFIMRDLPWTRFFII